MPFVESAVAEAREDELVPEGEYDLIISSVEEKEDRKGNLMFMCVLDIQNPPDNVSNPAPVFHYISTIGPEDDAKTRNFKLRMQRRFLECFEIPFEDNGFNTDDFEGAKGTCLVRQSEILRDGKPSGDYSHQLSLPKFANEPDDEVAKESEGVQPRRRRRT